MRQKRQENEVALNAKVIIEANKGNETFSESLARRGVFVFLKEFANI